MLDWVYSRETKVYHKAQMPWTTINTDDRKQLDSNKSWQEKIPHGYRDKPVKTITKKHQVEDFF